MLHIRISLYDTLLKHSFWFLKNINFKTKPNIKILTHTRSMMICIRVLCFPPQQKICLNEKNQAPNLNPKPTVNPKQNLNPHPQHSSLNSIPYSLNSHTLNPKP